MDLKQNEQEVLGVNLKKPVLNEHMHAHRSGWREGRGTVNVPRSCGRVNGLKATEQFEGVEAWCYADF